LDGLTNRYSRDEAKQFRPSGWLRGICPQIFDIVNGFFNRCRGASYSVEAHLT